MRLEFPLEWPQTRAHQITSRSRRSGAVGPSRSGAFNPVQMTTNGPVRLPPEARPVAPRQRVGSSPILVLSEPEVFLGHREHDDPFHRRGGLDGVVAATVARLGGRGTPTTLLDPAPDDRRGRWHR